MRALALLACLLLVAPDAQANRLFTCGYEENNLAQTMWTVVGGAPSIVTSPVHSGTYAFRVNPGNVRRDLAGPLTSGTTFVRFYFRFAVFPSSGQIFYMCRNASAVDNHNLSIVDSGANKRIRLTNVVTGETLDMTTNLSLNTWYRMEIRHLISDTVGEIELRLYDGDSTTPLETAQFGAANKDTMTTNVAIYVFGTPGGATIDLYFDDIAINDANGTFQNSWPGPGKIALLKPDSDVSVTWTKSGSTPAPTNWEGVDDVPGTPNDGVDYNEDLNTTNVDRLGLTDLPAEVPSSADIILADTYGRVGSNATTARSMIFRLWDEGGNATDGPVVNVNINGWKIVTTAEHQVFDAGTRTRADISSFNVGYKGNAGSNRAKWCTALWVNVEWKEALAGLRFIIVISP